MKLVDGKRGRFAEAVEKALALGDGLVDLVIGDEGHLFSSRFGCHECSVTIPELEPRLFHSTALLVRERCDGLGRRRSPFTSVVRDADLSIEDMELFKQGNRARRFAVWVSHGKLDEALKAGKWTQQTLEKTDGQGSQICAGRICSSGVQGGLARAFSPGRGFLRFAWRS